MTNKKFEFITNFLVFATALSVYGILMYNDIVLRKTGTEIPYVMILLVALLVVLIGGIIIINNIRKRRFGEVASSQVTVTWKHFLRTFIIVTVTNMILNEAHYIAKSARNGITPIEKAVTDITKIYGLYFILFLVVLLIVEYSAKKKANNTYTADE